MIRETKRFIVKIMAAAGFMILLAWIVFNFIMPGRYLPVLPLMLFFFTLVTIITYNYQIKLSKKNLRSFTNSSMIISFTRLMLYSLFAVVYLAINNEDVPVFVAGLILVYTVYTILEVTDLSYQVRRKKDTG